MVVGEDLHELIALFCSGVCSGEVQRVEAAAVGSSQAGKFQECGLASRCRVQVLDVEFLKVRALDHELAQWPLLERVLVRDVLDCELFETLLLVDSVGEIVKHRVDHLRRRAGEAITKRCTIRMHRVFRYKTSNRGFRNRLKVVIREPVIVDVWIVLSESL